MNAPHDSETKLCVFRCNCGERYAISQPEGVSKE